MTPAERSDLEQLRVEPAQGPRGAALPGRTAPPIPATCAHRPTTPDGLVIPIVNVRLADGGVDFRSQHDATTSRCWTAGLCQICGQAVGRPIVLLGGPRQLETLLFDEPPLHPECARYTAQACPMVGGQQAHYRTGPPLADRARGKTCAEPGCDCGGWVPTPGTGHDHIGQGRPAHAWFAFYVTGWSVGVDPATGRVTGGLCTPEQVLRVRQVSEPGHRFERPRPVHDWAEVRERMISR